MQRLKDIYYTDRMLDGYPSTEGVKQLSPQFYQGEDVKLSFYLNVNGVPVLTDKHIVEIYIKKHPSAENILWKAVMGGGLYNAQDKNNGFYYIIMPAEISALFLPGTYYMDAKIVEKAGTGQYAKDITTMIPLTTFNLELGAASPNPKLQVTKTEETTYDPETGITTITISTVEPTLPLPINVI